MFLQFEAKNKCNGEVKKFRIWDNSIDHKGLSIPAKYKPQFGDVIDRVQGRDILIPGPIFRIEWNTKKTFITK